MVARGGGATGPHVVRSAKAAGVQKPAEAVALGETGKPLRECALFLVPFRAEVEFAGTPGGEYLRRFWQPVCFSDDLKDLPFKVRMLGEDLVAYRDKRGTVGLLELNCRQGGRCAGGTSSSGVLPCALVAHRIKPYVTTR